MYDELMAEIGSFRWWALHNSEPTISPADRNFPDCLSALHLYYLNRNLENAGKDTSFPGAQ